MLRVLLGAAQAFGVDAVVDAERDLGGDVAAEEVRCGERRELERVADVEGGVFRVLGAAPRLVHRIEALLESIRFGHAPPGTTRRVGRQPGTTARALRATIGAPWGTSIVRLP